MSIGVAYMAAIMVMSCACVAFETQSGPVVVTVDASTGVVVGNKVLTSYHVLDNYGHPTVCVRNQCSSENVLRIDPTNDLALLSWSGRQSDLTVGTEPTTGDTLWLHGRGEVHRGKVIDGWPDQYNGYNISVVDVYLAPGSSGGPVTDNEGRLVGIINASSKKASITYLNDVDAIREFLGFVTSP